MRRSAIPSRGTRCFARVDNRKSDHDSGSGLAGFDFHIAAIGAPARACSNAHARPGGLNFDQLLSGHALAVVADLDGEGVISALNPDDSVLRCGVTMNVSQAFLDQAKHHQFQLSRNSPDGRSGVVPSEVFGNL